MRQKNEFKKILRSRGLNLEEFCDRARLTYRTFNRRLARGLVTKEELKRADQVLRLSDDELLTIIRD